MKIFYKNCVKIIVLFCVLSINPKALKAQNSMDNSTVNFWDNVRFGGGLGLSFGDGFFSGTITPMAIYDFNPMVSAGLGLNATFNNRRDEYKSTILGASMITLFNPVQPLQLSAEYELLNVNRKWDDVNIRDENYWYPGLFLGAGFRSRNLTVGVRYDVLYDDNRSIYTNAWVPFVRFYF
jgi:hypothetical protein